MPADDVAIIAPRALKSRLQNYVGWLGCAMFEKFK